MSNEKATAAAKQPKPGIAFDPQYIGRITGMLLAICLVVALLLGVVNQITKPKIDAIQAEKIRAAMSQVLQADEYIAWEGALPKNVTALSLAKTGGDSTGWVVQVTATGSQGPITMMVGVDMSEPMGKVTGVSIVSHSETPNIGSKVVGDQSVLDRFIGMSLASGEITVNTGSNSFDGVSGATVSSRGVTAGVNTALDAVASLNKEG